ncbi:MAG: GTPase Era [Clostridia bacterium]|nr:GTPase Era [Clostridia bacterium]
MGRSNSMTETKKSFRSGFVTIVGRPNVGKSTLLNALIGEKVAIVSSRPQTTRSRMMGILTEPDYQIVFLDTPGIHQPRTQLGEYMMKSVQEAMDGMDGLLMLVDVTAVTDRDIAVAKEMAGKRCPRVLALNKIDLRSREALLEVIGRFADLGFDAIIPISAKTGDGLEELKTELVRRLPEGPHYFPDDMVTDQPERVICAELIREKALMHLRDEVPHGIGVEIMAIRPVRDDLTEIHATIYCERDAHKGIIIGRGGSMLRTIGSEAREDIERLLDRHVSLQLWVKVRPDWRNKPGDLHNLGYDQA